MFLVYSNLIAVGIDGAELPIEMTPAPVAHAPSMDELLTRLWPIVPSSVVMRREVFDRIGGFSPAIAGCEDIYFWLMAREQGEFRYLPEKLARFAYDTYPELLRVLRRDIEGGTQNLIPMLHQRYGHRANALARYYRRHKVSMLSRVGLLALAHGDAREARQCFLRAIRWNPAQPKTYLRLMRTFMPPRLALRLSGKAARRAAETKRAFPSASCGRAACGSIGLMAQMYNAFANCMEILQGVFRTRVPRVSIVVPAYNAAATIAGTVESALAQTFRDLRSSSWTTARPTARAKSCRRSGIVYASSSNTTTVPPLHETPVRAILGRFSRVPRC